MFDRTCRNAAQSDSSLDDQSTEQVFTEHTLSDAPADHRKIDDNEKPSENDPTHYSSTSEQDLSTNKATSGFSRLNILVKLWAVTQITTQTKNNTWVVGGWFHVHFRRSRWKAYTRPWHQGGESSPIFWSHQLWNGFPSFLQNVDSGAMTSWLWFWNRWLKRLMIRSLLWHYWVGSLTLINT